MNFSRRGFLNLLGIAGVTAAVTPVSLFGSDEESNIIMPDRALTKGHFVVKPKRFIERIPEDQRVAHDDPMASRVIGRLTRHREPTKPFLIRDGELAIDPRVHFEGASVADAHAAFYVASHDLRSQFAAFTRETLSQVSEHLRPMATLVTIVVAPIHARPLYTEERGTARGFTVAATFRQFVVLGASQSEISTFETYSEHGEYPVDVPRDVEMGMLIRLDREVIAQGEVKVDRVAGILSRFTRTWAA